ncbi:hypothetical protein ABZ372_53525, partial [Streptomyces sp. NPDC005921]
NTEHPVFFALMHGPDAPGGITEAHDAQCSGARRFTPTRRTTVSTAQPHRESVVSGCLPRPTRPEGGLVR